MNPEALILIGALVFAMGVLTGVYLAVYWKPRNWWWYYPNQTDERKEKQHTIGFRGNGK